MIQATDITSGTDQKIGQLKAILYLLQTNLEGFKEEVDRSYELLKLGEMTDLSKKIEGSIINPFDSVFQVSDNIDNQVKYIIDKFVKSFIRANKDSVDVAFRSKTSHNDLHYAIVLNEDNMENRNKLFSFFDKYDLLEIFNKYPVYFQFVPLHLADKVKFSEVIKFD